jgi:hypothetical protein
MKLSCPKFSVPPNSYARFIVKSNGGRGREIRFVNMFKIIFWYVTARYHDGNWPGKIISRDHMRVWYNRERSEDMVELQCKVVCVKEELSWVKSNTTKLINAWFISIKELLWHD